MYMYNDVVHSCYGLSIKDTSEGGREEGREGGRKGGREGEEKNPISVD